MNKHTQLQLPIQCQSYVGLYSLYCDNWEKISKLRRDFDLDQTMCNVEPELF